MKQNTKILLIEDTETDARLIREYLGSGEIDHYQIENAKRLSEGLAFLKDNHFDVILLDLSLPDSAGIDTVKKVTSFSPAIPIIVLTGMKDEQIAIQSVQAGAQDYLVKDQLNSELLIRSINYAIERYHLRSELERVKYERQQEQELNSFRQMIQSSTTITSRSFGLGPLKDGQPEIFNEFVASFEKFLDLAIEKRVFQANNNLSTELRIMSEKLGFIRAGPRDVIDIFVVALENKSTDVNVEKAKAFMEEGRILMIQLMGHMISFYRQYYIQYQNNSKSNITE